MPARVCQLEPRLFTFSKPAWGVNWANVRHEAGYFITVLPAVADCWSLQAGTKVQITLALRVEGPSTHG